MKAIVNKFMPLISSAAFAVAFAMIGTTCRTWLYQPPVPAKLLEMDK